MLSVRVACHLSSVEQTIWQTAHSSVNVILRPTSFLKPVKFPPGHPTVCLFSRTLLALRRETGMRLKRLTIFCYPDGDPFFLQFDDPTWSLGDYQYFSGEKLETWVLRWTWNKLNKLYPFPGHRRFAGLQLKRYLIGIFPPTSNCVSISRSHVQAYEKPEEPRLSDRLSILLIIYYLFFCHSRD